MSHELLANPTQTIEMMTWNINAGGFDDYTADQSIPGREAAITDFISNKHRHGVSAVCLSDAYRWGDQYRDQNTPGDGIARHLGYKYARFVDFQDERLTADAGAGIGVAFATDHKIEQTRELDLITRQGMGVIIDIGRSGLQIANVYLDDLSEDLRIKQLSSLVNELEPDMPTIITGDLNALRDGMSQSKASIRSRDMAVRAVAALFPKRGGYLSGLDIPKIQPRIDRLAEIGTVTKDMNRRLAIPHLRSLEFADADAAEMRPTAPAKLPVYSLDYVFYNAGVQVTDVNVEKLPTAESDHRPLTYSVSV